MRVALPLMLKLPAPARPDVHVRVCARSVREKTEKTLQAGDKSIRAAERKTAQEIKNVDMRCPKPAALCKFACPLSDRRAQLQDPAHSARALVREVPLVHLVGCATQARALRPHFTCSRGSAENYLVIGGKDAQQNETIVRRYLKPHDSARSRPPARLSPLGCSLCTR